MRTFAGAAASHAAGRLSEALAGYDALIALDPGHARLWLNRGAVLADLGRPGEALSSYDQALALRPDYAAAHNNRGAAFDALGRLHEALASYDRAIALEPDHADALNNRGRALTALGRAEEALASFDRALALRPAYAAAHNNRGNALKNLGRLEAALANYDAAIAAQADLAEAYFNRGNVLVVLGRGAEAMEAFDRYIALRPDASGGHYNRANALKAAGRPAEAIEAYRRAIALRSDFPTAFNNLGAALEDLGDLEGAAANYRQALALDPAFAAPCNNLGNIMNNRGRPEEAAALFERAIAIDPDFAEAHGNLGAALMEMGDLARAAGAFRRAITLKPDHAMAHYHLARLPGGGDGESGETAFEVMSRQAETLDRLNPEAQGLLLFALGKALEDRGAFDEAFARLAQANALRREGLAFSIEAAEERLRRIAAAFDRPLLERLAGSGAPGGRAIFVVGMPRSGTTLVEQILGAHPAVLAAGEIEILPKQIISARGPGGSIYPDWASTMSGGDCRNIGATYLARLPQAAPGETRVTDKWLYNFEHLGLIHICLPGATIIHCRRDPRDVCLSCYGLDFRRVMDFAFDLTELGRYWRAYDRLMDYWRATLPPGRMLEVPYEAVVEDVETWARRLIAYCGLPWDDACLRFHESTRTVRTASSAQVRRPIYTASVGRWRRFERHLGPLLEALGEPWSDAGFDPRER